MVDIIHDSHSRRYRKPFGAVKSGETVDLRLKIKLESKVVSIFLVVGRGDEPKERYEMKKLVRRKKEEVYSAELYTSSFKGLISYYFEVNLKEGTYYYGNSHDGFGGRGMIYGCHPKPYQITVYSSEAEVPDWYKEGIIYQIFPDRFYNGNPESTVNRPTRDMILRSKWEEDPSYLRAPDGSVVYYDYFGGNLIGIIKKLDYLKELGVTILYLNPIFESGSNHKYDTGDYLKVDKMFGDEKIFKRLCERAKAKGISIVLDGVFSHTGSDSVYFNRKGKYDSKGAYQSRDSEYYSWYRFEEYPDKYESWWGIDVLPNVNEEDSSYKEFILGKGGVIEKWTKLGARGWRLDVADELPDSFIKSLRKKLKELDEEAVVIGEVWEDASKKVSYGECREYLLGAELDSTMNYPFRDMFIRFIMGELDAYGLHRRAMSLYENYPKEYFHSAMNLVGTHDSVRIIYALGRVPDSYHMSEEQKKSFRMTRESKEEAIEKLKMLSLVQMTYPGVPSIYYGDEAGLEGYSDPYNRRTYPWGHENAELMKWYRKVTSIRNGYPVFRLGEFKSIPINENVYGYMREKTDLGFVVINRSDRAEEIEVNFSRYRFKKLYEILNKREYVLESGKLKVKLNPRDKLVFVAKKTSPLK